MHTTIPLNSLLLSSPFPSLFQLCAQLLEYDRCCMFILSFSFKFPYKEWLDQKNFLEGCSCFRQELRRLWGQKIQVSQGIVSEQEACSVQGRKKTTKQNKTQPNNLQPSVRMGQKECSCGLVGTECAANQKIMELVETKPQRKKNVLLSHHGQKITCIHISRVFFISCFNQPSESFI